MSWYTPGGTSEQPRQPSPQEPTPPPTVPPPPPEAAAGTPGGGYQFRTSAPQPDPGEGREAGGRSSGKALAALVLAILSFFTLGIILAIVALILANSAQKEIAASGGQIGGAGQARAARLLALINIILSVLVLVGVVAYLIFR
jgi:hypothetical protein